MFGFIDKSSRLFRKPIFQFEITVSKINTTIMWLYHEIFKNNTLILDVFKIEIQFPNLSNNAYIL